MPYYFSKAFTLVELLVVVSIIALLSALVIPKFIELEKESHDTQRKSDIKQLQSALQQYYADQGFYPASPLPAPGSALTSSVGRPEPTPTPEKTYLQDIPADPTDADNNYSYVSLPSTPACDNVAATSNYCRRYCLCAVMEKTSNEYVGSTECQTACASYNYRVGPY